MTVKQDSDVFRQTIQTSREISFEYIRGLTEGEGSFTFSTNTIARDSHGRTTVRRKIPAFALVMSQMDKQLLTKVKEKLNLKNKIYSYPPRVDRFSHNRQGMCILIIRDVGQLKNKIVPLFYKKLHGHKALQFEAWIDKIGTDPEVSPDFKIIYQIYKAGFYDRNPKFADHNV